MEVIRENIAKKIHLADGLEEEAENVEPLSEDEEALESALLEYVPKRTVRPLEKQKSQRSHRSTTPDDLQHSIAAQQLTDHDDTETNMDDCDNGPDRFHEDAGVATVEKDGGECK